MSDRGSRPTRNVAFIAALAALAVAPPVIALWRHLPPLHEDEILPLVPLFLLKKTRDAVGGAFLAGCPRSPKAPNEKVR